MNRLKSIKIEMDNKIPKLYINDTQIDLSDCTEMDINIHLSPYNSTIQIDSSIKYFLDDKE